MKMVNKTQQLAEVRLFRSRVWTRPASLQASPVVTDFNQWATVTFDLAFLSPFRWAKP